MGSQEPIFWPERTQFMFRVSQSREFLVLWAELSSLRSENGFNMSEKSTYMNRLLRSRLATEKLWVCKTGLWLYHITVTLQLARLTATFRMSMKYVYIYQCPQWVWHQVSLYSRILKRHKKSKFEICSWMPTYEFFIKLS